MLYWLASSQLAAGCSGQAISGVRSPGWGGFAERAARLHLPRVLVEREAGEGRVVNACRPLQYGCQQPHAPAGPSGRRAPGGECTLHSEKSIPPDTHPQQPRIPCATAVSVCVIIPSS